MSRFKKHAEILRILAKAKPPVIRAIIKDSGTDLLYLLSECAVNILKGNVKLSKNNRIILKKQANRLRKLASKNTSINNRRKIIQQGGFIPALLGAILPAVLGGVLHKIIP